MGRPAKWKDIPPEEVEGLFKIGCSTAEVADFFGVSRQTIELRFRQELLKGRAGLKTRLRRLQVQAAEGGNVTMLIFLGKNMLGQSDRVTHEHAMEAPRTVRVTRELEPSMNGHGANGDGFHRS